MNITVTLPLNEKTWDFLQSLRSNTEPVMVPVAPAPPVVAPVPTVVAPAPPVVAPAHGVETDGEGLPWDARIHASTKTRRVADNTWKLMKGVDKDLVEKVKAELRSVMSAPVAPAPPVVVNDTPVAPAPPVAKVTDAPEGYRMVGKHTYAELIACNWTDEMLIRDGYMEPVAPAPPTPVTPAPPVTPAVQIPADFPSLLMYVTDRQSKGKLSLEEVTKECITLGIPTLAAMANRLDLVPALWQACEAICHTRL